METAWRAVRVEKLTCTAPPTTQPDLMKLFLRLLTLPVLGFSSLLAQTAETWVLADGRMFEAQVKMVTPGTVLFTMRTGADQPLEISKLSDRSKKQLLDVLGLGSVPVSPATPTATAAVTPPPVPPATPMPAAAPTPPTPPAPAMPAAAGTMATVPRDAGAIDVTDTGSIDARYGLTATVIGKVKRLASLGGAGHKLIEFEDSDFNVFINKRQLEASTDWHLEGLEGKLIQATGKVGKYNEKLQIQLFEPSQVGVVE